MKKEELTIKKRYSAIQSILKLTLILFILNSKLLTLNSLAQEPAWGTQAKADSLEARSQRSMQRFHDAIDGFLMADFLSEGIKLNTLMKTTQFLLFPAENPELGAYLANFEKETGASIIIRAYIDIDYHNIWATSFLAAQRKRKAFEINSNCKCSWRKTITYRSIFI